MNVGFAPNILLSTLCTTSETVGVLKTQPRLFLAVFNIID